MRPSGEFGSGAFCALAKPTMPDSKKAKKVKKVVFTISRSKK
jgi:hypothetical protein